MEIQRTLPISDQVRNILLERIQTGQYPAGTRFPSESELCQEFNISRATVRTALTSLETRGLVVRQSGVGTFVSTRQQIATGLEQLESVLNIARRNGLQPGVRELSIQTLPAPEMIAEALNIEVDTPVTRISRTVLAENIPVSYHEDYVPAALLTSPHLDNFNGSVLEYLTAHHPHPILQAQTEITAVIASAVMAVRLEVKPGSALILLKEILQDEKGTAVDYSDNYFVPDRFQLKFIRRS